MGEQTIATNAEYSYRYARDVLKGRFELGEPVIASGALYSFWYAYEAIYGRFELGEAAIAEHGVLKAKYFDITGIRL